MKAVLSLTTVALLSALVTLGGCGDSSDSGRAAAQR